MIDNLKEKLGSRLYCCIFFAWLAYNWKPIVIFIFSNEDLYLKIRHISVYASPDRQLWEPLIWGCLVAVVFPLANSFYGFIDVFISALIHSKNALTEIVTAWVDNYRNYSKFKTENYNKVRFAKLELDLANIEKEKTQKQQEKALLEAELESIDEAKSKISELTKEAEKAKEEVMLINNKLENYALSNIENQKALFTTNEYLLQIAKFLEDCSMKMTLNPEKNMNSELAREIKDKLEEITTQVDSIGIKSYANAGLHPLESGNYHTLHNNQE